MPVLEFPTTSGLQGEILFFIMYKNHVDANALEYGVEYGGGRGKRWRPIYKSEIKS